MLVERARLVGHVGQPIIFFLVGLKQRGVQPGLVFVRVGEDPASQVYVGMKERMSARLGIVSFTRVLPEATSEADLLRLIAHLNVLSLRDGVYVEDIGSTNGTFVNGVRLNSPKKLSLGDVIRIGETDLRFER